MNSGLMIFLILITLYPFLHVFFGALSEPNLIAKHRGLLLRPLGLSLESFRMVFNNPMIGIGYRNTLFYVTLGTALNILVTSLAAFALSKKRFMLKNFIMFAFVFTMFFEGGLIPTYLLIVRLGWIDSVFAVTIPVLINTWNLIVMRTSFDGIPDSLEESAKMDGANDFFILFKIILPLSVPLLAVMILFYGVAHWNSWFQALIYFRSRSFYPLQLVLREILIENSMSDSTSDVADMNRVMVEYSIKYATIVVSVVPILLLYPFLQKYFVKGVMIGAVKG